jgi:cell division protein FtsB
MRVILLFLTVLVVGIQYPLWFGKSGWFRSLELAKQLSAQRRHIDELRARNARLEGEVRDLRDGTAAVEERARFELGLVREGEVFVQFVGDSPNFRGGASQPIQLNASKNQSRP